MAHLIWAARRSDHNARRRDDGQGEVEELVGERNILFVDDRSDRCEELVGLDGLQQGWLLRKLEEPGRQVAPTARAWCRHGVVPVLLGHANVATTAIDADLTEPRRVSLQGVLDRLMTGLRSGARAVIEVTDVFRRFAPDY